MKDTMNLKISLGISSENASDLLKGALRYIEKGDLQSSLDMIGSAVHALHSAQQTERILEGEEDG